MTPQLIKWPDHHHDGHDGDTWWSISISQIKSNITKSGSKDSKCSVVVVYLSSFLTELKKKNLITICMLDLRPNGSYSFILLSIKREMDENQPRRCHHYIQLSFQKKIKKVEINFVIKKKWCNKKKSLTNNKIDFSYEKTHNFFLFCYWSVGQSNWNWFFAFVVVVVQMYDDDDCG